MSTSLEKEALGKRLNGFRAYLKLLARTQIEAHFRPKIDDSSLAEQTIAEAFQRWDQFCGGDNDAQLAGWLRTMLAHNVADAMHYWRAQKRDVFNECAIQDAVERSSVSLEGLLCTEQASPSACAVKSEQMLRLAEALEQLDDDQRRAIEWHHLHAMKSSEVARRMGKTPAAVAGLLHRGLKKLRTLMQEDDDDRP